MYINNTAKVITGYYIKHLDVPRCLDTYIYLPATSGWTLPEQDKDNIDPREGADATLSPPTMVDGDMVAMSQPAQGPQGSSCPRSESCPAQTRATTGAVAFYPYECIWAGIRRHRHIFQGSCGLGPISAPAWFIVWSQPCGLAPSGREACCAITPRVGEQEGTILPIVRSSPR